MCVWEGVGRWGCGVGGEERLVTSYMWHNTDVRADWPSFIALPGI